jgi:hypothetical protein
VFSETDKPTDCADDVFTETLKAALLADEPTNPDDTPFESAVDVVIESLTAFESAIDVLTETDVAAERAAETFVDNDVAAETVAELAVDARTPADTPLLSAVDVAAVNRPSAENGVSPTHCFAPALLKTSD